MNKVILTDVDGVLLDWEEHFRVWMSHEYGYDRSENLGAYRLAEHYGLPEDTIWDRVEEFNYSTHAGFMRPHEEAVKYVRLLADKGYRFITVTSFGGSPESRALRVSNLQYLFGDVFDGHNIIELCGDKRKTLTQFKNSASWWIEDNLHNAEVGLELGLRPILMRHTHNSEASADLGIRRADGWSQVYTIITGEKEHAD